MKNPLNKLYRGFSMFPLVGEVRPPSSNQGPKDYELFRLNFFHGKKLQMQPYKGKYRLFFILVQGLCDDFVMIFLINNENINVDLLLTIFFTPNEKSRLSLK